MRLRFAISSLAILAALTLPPSASAVEIFVGDGVPLDPASTPTGTIPVLFVHGHNPGDEVNDPNYRRNWLLPLGSLPSFSSALTRNSGLGIEPYFIRFTNQDHSIVNDAIDIRDAVNIILERHDSGFDHNVANSSTSVKVVIIAYSKGTISTRLYLKSLDGSVPAITPPLQTNFHPVSEFIAIAPPNHGINISGLSGLTTTSGHQLLNGFRPDCSDFAVQRNGLDFIKNLNGHPIEDTKVRDFCAFYPSEAPGSRSPTQPPTDGILYVTLFADRNRDFVGGETPSSDCQGRRLALNLSPNAVNIPVPEITFDGWENVNDFFGILSEAERQTVAVHQNTVHTPEVICQALDAAVRHRSPVGQTCTLDVGVPVIPPAARAAAMLALDFSGSMSAPACLGCPNKPRVAVLKDAVEEFVQLWSAMSVPSDRLGVTYFRTNVDQFDLVGETLPLLSDGGDDIILDVTRPTQRPNNRTAMGGGLQRAIEALKGVAADTRRVILFTDGMQNVNPMVQSRVVQGAPCHFIARGPGRLNSNVLPTAPPTVLNPSLGIAVDTIGIGAGEPFVGLLEEIATATGGRTRVTMEPDAELSQMFLEELIDALRGFSPQLVAYRHGALAANGNTEAFAIEDGVRKVVLKVSWKRGDSIDFSVAKDGVDVTSAGRFIDGAFYKIFVIDLPGKVGIGARGNWELRIKGKAGTAYETAAIVDGGHIAYDATFVAKRPRAGDPLDLVVSLTADGQPIPRNARVTVLLRSPNAAVGDIIARIPPQKVQAFEPGTTTAEAQMFALVQDPKSWAALKPLRETVILKATDRGDFRTQIRPTIPGIYTAFVTIEGDDDKRGHFSRTLTVTTVVRFAAANLKNSDISVSQTAVKGGWRNVSLVVSPRDARGQRLGPGLSSAISLQLSAGRRVGETRDLGDGRYLLVMAVAPGDDPTIKLEVAGGRLFTGRLSKLPRNLSKLPRK